MHEPKLLILDEPTAGVDIEIRRSMWEFLRNINDAGTTIILTTHYLEEAENLCRTSPSSRAAHHRARQHGQCAAQAADRSVRVQLARIAAGRAAIIGIHATLSDPHTLEIENGEVTESQ